MPTPQRLPKRHVRGFPELDALVPTDRYGTGSGAGSFHGVLMHFAPKSSPNAVYRANTPKVVVVMTLDPKW